LATDFNYGNAMMIGGSMLSAGADFYSAWSALKSSYASQILKYKAAYIDAVTEIEVEKKKRELKKIIGSQRMQTAASNIMPDVGTPMELQIESEILNEIDINLIRIAGSMEKVGLAGEAYQQKITGLSTAGQHFARGSATALNSMITQMGRQKKTTSEITNTRPRINTPWGGK